MLQWGDGLILLTEWKEFRSPDFDEIKIQLKKNLLFLMVEISTMHLI